MSTRLAGPSDNGEGLGQEGSDISAKSLDRVEIGGKAMGDDPTRRNPLVREPKRRTMLVTRAIANGTERGWAMRTEGRRVVAVA